MSLAKLIPLLLRACIVTSVFALGLNVTWESISYLWHQVGLLLRSLLAMYVITPLIAVLLVLAFHASVGVKIAVLLMAISAGAPILPKKLLKLGANARYVYSLAVTAALFAIVTVPVSLAILGAFFHREASVPLSQVAYTITVVFLAPLLAGMLAGDFWPAFAKRIGGILSTVAGVVLLVLAVLIVVVNFSPVLGMGFSAFALIVAITLAELAVGHFLGGPDPNDRTALAMICSARFPALVLLIATLNFPGAKPLPFVVTYLLVSNLATIPYVRWRKASSEAQLSERNSPRVQEEQLQGKA